MKNSSMSMQYKPIAAGALGGRNGRPCFLKIFIMTACALVVVGIFCVLALNVWSYPLHASCQAKWYFETDCGVIHKSIVNQIKTWTSADNCKNGGEKCLYSLLQDSENEIVATHTTPKKHYIDDMTFYFFSKNDTCTVKGKSRSKTWYAVLDFGTNYCNMHNLITGARLDKKPGYKEETSNSVCTQYSSADCERY